MRHIVEAIAGHGHDMAVLPGDDIVAQMAPDEEAFDRPASDAPSSTADADLFPPPSDDAPTAVADPGSRTPAPPPSGAGRSLRADSVSPPPGRLLAAGAVAGPVDAPFLDVPGTPPVTRGDGWFWLFIAFAGFVGGQVVGVVFTSVGAAITGNSAHLTQLSNSAEPPEWFILSGIVGLWVGFGSAPLIVSRFRGTRNFVFDLGLRFRWIDLTGIVWGVLASYAITLAYDPFQHHYGKIIEAPEKKLTGGSSGWEFLLTAAALVIGSPFFEELIFRGVLFKSLVRVFVPAGTTRPGAVRVVALVGAVIVDGLLFGLAHGEWIQLPALAVFGMFLAFMSYRTGRLGMNMVSHASFNAVAVVSLVVTHAVKV
jgi:membrane protease YdiL (CAAX protease family)